MAKYCIVILNYIDWQDTVNCIDSFLKNGDGIELSIIVVDNGSKNESVQELEERYKNLPNIIIAPLAENQGFAKGNNYGFNIAKRKNDFDYFIFSNSDILIQPGLFRWIEEVDKQSKFDVLGPDIFAKKMNVHQNPLATYTDRIIKIYLNIIKRKIAITCLKLGIDYDDQYKRKRVYSNISEENTSTRYQNVTVHGSFVIFNKSYFSHYDMPFDGRTFLYMEEHILFQRCRKKNLKMIVDLTQQVIHLQGASTERVSASIRKRKIWKLENEIKSIQIYKAVIKDK